MALNGFNHGSTIFGNFNFMHMNQTIRFIALVLLALGIEVWAGVTVTLTDGSVYENAEIKRIEAGGVVLAHNGGVARISTSKMSLETRKSLGLKPTLEMARWDFGYQLKEFKKRFSELDAIYDSHLTKLGAEAQKSGLLTEVLEVKKEQSGFLNRTKPNPMKYEKLKNLRSMYEGGQTKLKGKVVEDLKHALIKFQADLGEVKKELVKSNKLEKGVVVEKEEERITALLKDPNQAFVSLGIIVVKDASLVITPDGEKGSLPLCRIVMIPINQTPGAANPSTFDAVEKADKTDIIRIGRANFPNVGAIQRDGSLIYWRNGAVAPELVAGKNIFCDQSHGLPLIGLDQDGTLNFTSDVKENLIKALKAQTGIGQFEATSGAAVFTKRAEGTVSVIGRTANPTAEKLQTLLDVKSVSFSGLSFATVLKRDGSVVKISNGNLNGLTQVTELDYLHCFGFGNEKSGSLISFGGIPQSIADDVGMNPKQVFAFSSYFVAISSDGHFFFRTKSTNGDFERVPEIEEALSGASAFAIEVGPGPQKIVWIIALLPTDEVPRSGVWEAADLVKARAK